MNLIESVEFRADLDAAIQKLTDRQRVVWVMTNDGYTQDEIAAELDITHQAVSCHLEAARTSLENSLKEYLQNAS